MLDVGRHARRVDEVVAAHGDQHGAGDGGNPRAARPAARARGRREGSRCGREGIAWRARITDRAARSYARIDDAARGRPMHRPRCRPSTESAAQFLLAARNRGTPGPRIPDEWRPDRRSTTRSRSRRASPSSSASRSAATSARCPTEPRPRGSRRSSRRRSRAASPVRRCAASGAIGAQVEPEIAFVLGARPACARRRPTARRTCATR